MKTVIEMAKEAGALPSREPFLNHFLIDKATLERFADLIREDERSQSNPVNDEIIAELWHKAGGHLHRFARLLEQFMVKL